MQQSTPTHTRSQSKNNRIAQIFSTTGNKPLTVKKVLASLHALGLHLLGLSLGFGFHHVDTVAKADG